MEQENKEQSERKLISKKEALEEHYLFQNSLQIGDLSVQTFKPLHVAQQTLINLLKNKQVKNYLKDFKAKKIMGSPSYTE